MIRGKYIVVSVGLRGFRIPIARHVYSDAPLK